MHVFILIINLLLYCQASKNDDRLNYCEYKFVVPQNDDPRCHSVLPMADISDDGSQDDPFHSDERIKQPKFKNMDRLDFKLKDMESRLLDEVVKNRELNSTLERHERLLQKGDSLLATYKTKLSKVFRAIMLMEQKLKRQRKISRNLNQKLSNVVLDVVEVNNYLMKKVPSVNLANDKQIIVESIADSRVCTGYDENVQIYKDCSEAYDDGHIKNGVYFVRPSYAPCAIPVWCDMQTAPGGWLLVQKRYNGDLDFNRDWQDYKKGFGDISAEFWLGNDNLFLLSNQNHYELRIDLWDFTGNRVYASYNTFKIDGERDNYKLHIHGFSGSAKDSLYKHNKMSFSTPDRDNDDRREAHCAREWEGGWWFNNCWFAYLNGPYHNHSDIQWRGIAWNHWKREQLHKSEMKIRPVDRKPV